jgi:hypothetical protein
MSRRRIESSVLSVSWIPSEAIKGLTKLPFSLGVTHYDKPPPARVDPDDLQRLSEEGRFRFANRLEAWVDVDNDSGEIVGAGYSGRSYISRTVAKLGPAEIAFQPLPFTDLQAEPDQVSPTEVRFVQSAGGRPGIPAPRRVRRKPYFQLVGPNVWTTLALTLSSDGSARHEVLGASTFPRHWVYDARGRVAEKIGAIDFGEWYTTAFGKRSPWGNFDSPALVTEVESALERELSAAIMREGAKTRRRKVAAGKTLVQQGDAGDDLFLLLDGVLGVEVDGEKVTELGPGAVLGERAILEGRGRTSTLRAITDARVAVVPRQSVSVSALAELAKRHKRERGRR